MADGVRKKRHRNGGIRKLCRCPRRNWPKCPDAWYFNFKLPGGLSYVFSLDRELGRHIKTKEEAQIEAEKIRIAIREGTFIRAAERRKLTETAKAEQPGAITFDAFAKVYVDRVASVRERNKSWKDDQHKFSLIGAFRLTDGARLGDKAMGAITEDDIEAFIVDLRTKGRAASTRNQYVQVLKASFRWAAKKGYISRSPIDTSEIIRRHKPGKRNRRLVPAILDKDAKVIAQSEEQHLLDAAPPHLQRLIIAALETCCRRGELLALRWADVDLDSRRVRVRAETAKDAEERILPISDRLAGVLEMAKTDPAGDDYPRDAFVFGEFGCPVKSIKKSWETTVLKAHGHEPTWRKGGLSPASRRELKTIDLHFHDLRHEAGSRLHERGMPLHHVKEMLGHASLDQTTTYLNVKIEGMQESMRRIDDGRSRCNPVVNETAVEQRTVYNDTATEASKPLVN